MYILNQAHTYVKHILGLDWNYMCSYIAVEILTPCHVAQLSERDAQLAISCTEPCEYCVAAILLSRVSKNVRLTVTRTF